jgi:hypothetical protein
LVESCIHLANLVYLLSYLDRDMLHLRVLTCVGLMLGLVFFTCQPSPLYAPTAWQVVFLVINAVQIRRLVRERRRLRLTEEQERLGEATFHDLSREELLTLLTRVMYEKPERLRDIDRLCEPPLNKDEVVLRDMAFSRLSRQELLNLLTRRLWNSLARRNPVRRREQRRPPPMTVPHDPEREVARRPLAR